MIQGDDTLAWPRSATGHASDGAWSAPHALADVVWLAVFVVIAVWALTRGARPLAARLGLVDDARDAPERKIHRRPVPLVGGIVLALTLVAWACVRGADVVGGSVAFGVAFDPRAVWAACALAFLTGLVDDLAPRGLGPLAKLAGQITAGLALASGLEVLESPASLPLRALAVFAAVAAQNAANTFDNADGALCGVAAVAFAFVGPFASAIAAFLPLNLPCAPFRRAAPDAGARTPRAWLGDAGSHLVGVLMLTTPVAWAGLLVPFVDLARVVCVRLAAGHPIWRGDRRHAAHALADRGFAPAHVVIVLALASLPALIWAAAAL